MPNPENPDEAECRVCFDSGVVPFTNRLCVCTGMGGEEQT